MSDEQLLRFGVPPEWLEEVQTATEDTILDLADHLPSEAAEALLELATGNALESPVHAAADVDPFDHPDSQRRFRVMADAEELSRALDSPWDKWTVFLHPVQRKLVEHEFNGTARHGRYRQDYRCVAPSSISGKNTPRITYSSRHSRRPAGTPRGLSHLSVSGDSIDLF